MPRSKHARPGPAAPLSKRERVVAAASKLFLDEGYGATGMDAIAKEADVSKATLYSYYDDKSALFADVMSRMCEEAGGHLQMEALIGGSPEDTLRAIALHGLRRILAAVRRQFLQRVVAESREFPELGRKFWENGPGRIQGALTLYLEDAKRRRTLRVDDPARDAARLVGQITGLYLLPLLAGIRNPPSEAEIRRDVDEIVGEFVASRRRES
jgi:TetR/AcrR family transcriptional regulator, mexJK operon transcriptional repressor